MPKKVIFNKQDIIAASLCVLKKADISHLTVRKIARELRSSTAPIYQQFRSMPDLTEAVLTKIKDDVVENFNIKRTDRVFLNIGMGYVCYARDFPNLFRVLFLEKHNYRHIVKNFFDMVKNKMNEDLRFDSLELKLKNLLIKEMWIYSHGLASMIVAGNLKEVRDNEIKERLDKIGTIIISNVLKK
jgi:AcrR family transcriptional regulator